MTSVGRTIASDPDHVMDVLIHNTRALLQRATATEPAQPAGDGSFVMRVAQLGGRVHHEVRCRIGQAHHNDQRLEIPLRLVTPAAMLQIPELSVDLIATRAGADRTRVTVDGHYVTPSGLLDAVVDRLALRTVVRSLLTDLLDGIVRELLAQPAAAEDAVVGLLVRDLMTAAPITLPEPTPLRRAAELLLERRISGIPVVDDTDEIVGVLSEADLLRHVASPEHHEPGATLRSTRRRRNDTVGAACSRPARTTSADVPIAAAAAEMAQHDVARLVVLEGAEVAGILTRSDVLNALIHADVAIEERVSQVLHDHGLDDVVVASAGGRISLTGDADQRTTGAWLERILAPVEGVVSVDSSQVAWRGAASG